MALEGIPAADLVGGLCADPECSWDLGMQPQRAQQCALFITQVTLTQENIQLLNAGKQGKREAVAM